MGAVVELTVNGEAAVSIKDGMPLFLHVTVTTSDAEPVTLGAHLTPWWEKVAVYGADGRQVFWPFEALDRRPATNEVALTPGATAELELAVGPRELSTVRPGVHELEVRLPVGGAPEPARSNVVRVDLVGKPLTAREKAQPTFLTTMAVYLTKRGNYLEARSLIDTLVADGSASTTQLLLIGQMQEAGGDVEGAIRTCEHARARFFADHPGTIEGPGIIDTRILRLRRRTKAR